MHIFWNKNAKITSASGWNPPVCLWGLGALLPDSHVITPAYYCKSAEFISSTKWILLPSRKNKITAVNVLLLLLLSLSHLFFISNSVVFVDGGHKNVSCPRSQNILATPLLKQSGKWPKRVLEFNFSIVVATMSVK